MTRNAYQVNVPAHEVTQGITHHPKEWCDDEPCPFHRPSEHPLVYAPMNLVHNGLIVRFCSHDFWHPDPDSVAWHLRQLHGVRTDHACDGCCLPPISERELAEAEASLLALRVELQRP